MAWKTITPMWNSTQKQKDPESTSDAKTIEVQVFTSVNLGDKDNPIILSLRENTYKKPMSKTTTPDCHLVIDEEHIDGLIKYLQSEDFRAGNSRNRIV